jgi:hypothetical protein
MAKNYFLKQIDCFDVGFCQNIVSKIHGLKAEWTSRMGFDIPFYTLGAASYLDDQEDYFILVKKKNPLLLEHFRELYIRLAEILKDEIREIIKYDEQLALPGFHIFESHPIFETPVAACHFDLQYQRRLWPYQNIDLTRPISFTLSLKLPNHGGGLNYWDLEYEPLKDKTRQEIEKIQEETEKKYIPYKVGSMIVQQGLFLHQIAPAENLLPTDERITLQGHGLICDGALRLYW